MTLRLGTFNVWGLPEAFADDVSLIEWPDRAPALREDADLVIELSYDGEGRSARLTASNERAAAALSGIDLK